MNLNLKKSVLLVGALASLGLSYTTEALATSPNFAVNSVQQSKKVTGTVSDAEGPIIGASVVEKGNPGNGAVTDLDGNFALNVKPGATIVITYIGYQKQEIAVGNQSNFNITLKTDDTALDEVVVVGYGVQKKKLVTGATVEIKGENVAKLNTTQVLGALQSQSPGVNIQSVSGQPGDGFKVSIRGAGTNSSTAPVYVIDGVSGGDINSLNPADIERIDVLKDAASCAIYGSSAANGVILITTKQGKLGKVSVSYDGNIGWSNVYRLPQMLNAKQYMDVLDLYRFNNGQSGYDWDSMFSRESDKALLESYRNGSNAGTNWMEEFRNKNAVVTNHSFNVSGGNEMSKFSTGIGYQYQDGVFGGPVKSDFRRFTFRLNSEHILYKKGDLDVVKFGENVYYQHKQNQGVQQGDFYSNDLSNMLRGVPLIPVKNSDGDYFMYDDFNASGLFGLTSYASNPIASAVYGQGGNNKSKSFNLNTVAYLEVQPIKGLTYRGQIAYKQWSSSYRCFLPTYKMNTADNRNVNQTTNNVDLGWNWTLTNTLNYKFDLNKIHHFDVLAGTEYYKSRPDYGESVNATGYNNIFSDLAHGYLSNTQQTNTATVSGTPAAYGSKMSYFGRLNYDFNETYMLSLIMRADGSSNFAKGHQWGYFPSVSAGWVISNEKFMQSTSKWLTFLKLRAGWGQNGNDNIDASLWRSSFVFDNAALYSFDNNKTGATTGARPTRLANEELTWETSEQLNIGLDARFLDGRLAFTADWYNKKTKDLLVEVGNSSVAGFDSHWANAGTVENKGLELTLGWNDNIGKDFSYNVGWNMAYNKNNVSKVNNSNHFVEGGAGVFNGATKAAAIARMEEGHSIGYFYGFKTAGVIQNQEDLQNYIASNCGGKASNSLQGDGLKPGDLKFVDTNNDGVINDKDKVDLGSPLPDVTMGINLGASYKGFDLSVTGFWSMGAQVVRNWRKGSDSYYNNYTTEVYQYWSGEGTSNKYPILGDGSSVNWNNFSDIYVENANYFRLQNLTVGYDFKNIWKNSPFQQLRLYFTAQNLFTITNYKGMDPENGRALNSSEPWVTGVDMGNYPSPRTYMIGVNVKF